nr:uncharacterized protein LOC112939723 [Oryza sativa Japonica Group]
MKRPKKAQSTKSPMIVAQELKQMTATTMVKEAKALLMCLLGVTPNNQITTAPFNSLVRATSLMLLRTRIMVLQALNELPLHRESDNSNNSVTYNRIALAHSVPLALKVAIQRMCTTVPKLLIILLLHGCMNGKSLSGMLNCTLSGKQHHHGQVKVGRNTRRGCYIHMA